MLKLLSKFGAAALATSFAATVFADQPHEGGLGIQTQVTANGEYAKWMHDDLLVPVITIISLVVLALLLWAMWKFRAKANPVASKNAHNTTLEVAWTLIPALILAAIAFPSFTLLARQTQSAPKNAVTLKATAHQWYWSYTYPDLGDFEVVANMLPKEEARKRGEPPMLATDYRVVLPVGVTIRLQVTSEDVIHAWFVPAFWTQEDAVPGRINEAQFTIEKPGVYYGQCNQICGARHGYMPITVEAVSKADFDKWIASKKAPASAGATPATTPAAPAAPTVTPTAAPEAPATKS